MQHYVAQTWGWAEAWQRDYFQHCFNPEECQIITFQGRDVGVLSVLERETEVSLNLLEILPEYQNQGIGTAVIKSVFEATHHTGQPVGLQVLKVNPARLLYERLDFLITGETATHYLMRASPKSKPAQQDVKTV